MKGMLLASMAAALLFTSATAMAKASDKVVSVTFADICQETAKDGSTLDPKLFSFGPEVKGASQDQSRAQTSGMGRDKEGHCRHALLGAFLKFQAKAKAEGKRVVGIRTIAGDQESDKADACLCLAGGFVVRSVVKAGYK
jgi:hypothetical protein